MKSRITALFILSLLAALLLAGCKKRLTEENTVELKVGETCEFSESEKQSIPYRWRYMISDESLIGVSSDEVHGKFVFNAKSGGDKADRVIKFIALAPGECEITLRYGKYGETDWDGEFVTEHVYRVVIK